MSPRAAKVLLYVQLVLGAVLAVIPMLWMVSASLMPAGQGVMAWPQGRNLATLGDEEALPFPDAFFESVSGYTTTGSTVLVGLDAMSRSMEISWPHPLLATGYGPALPLWLTLRKHVPRGHAGSEKRVR